MSAGPDTTRDPETPGTVMTGSYVVEVVSDSGEGAQKAGQTFATIAARSGHGVWTTEIIPAEIQPPARSIAGASGNRIRIGSGRVTNGGDEADLVIAFNEQVLLGREQAGELAPGATVLLEAGWRSHPEPAVAAAFAGTVESLRERGLDVREIPLGDACRPVTDDPRKGKNMFVVGMLVAIFGFDLDLARAEVAATFARKDPAVAARNRALVDAGHGWATAHLDLRVRVPRTRFEVPQVVMNGNTALGLGVIASGMEVCAMYPITPATSASHYLAEVFERAGGVVHQAEDEIAAATFAIGASWAGRCAVTITSGPGLSLIQEAMGLAVMGEVPLVVIDVQRGGPSTGQPTKVEQGDLLAAISGSHGDAPKIVIAASDVADCFDAVVTARSLAELFRTVVVVLSDAKLATAQQLCDRPVIDGRWMAAPVDRTPVAGGDRPYEWDELTGLSERFVPGRPGGMHTLTGLAHDEASRVAYDPEVNERGLARRSAKLATLARSLRTPEVVGDREGGLLVIGWGSTRGEIEEAVGRLRGEGEQVSSMHLRFLSPLPPGIGEVLGRFDQVMTVEMSWSDPPGGPGGLISADTRRYASLAQLLRARWLVDVDCWSQVRGQPIKPRAVEAAIRAKLAAAARPAAQEEEEEGRS